MVLDIGDQGGPRPKCHFTQATLPTFVDHEQPPTKQKPFSTVLGQVYNHTLDVLCAADQENAIQQALANCGALQYAKVNMKLIDLLSGDFFSQYVKTGNIIMLSEGRPGVDNVFSLHEGNLRLEVSKPTYERAGLQGTPLPNEGRKHVKARFAIDINLRQPSMVRGHKGFERILWACRNVFDQAITWLFCDLRSIGAVQGPIMDFRPLVQSVEASIDQLDDAFLPRFAGEQELSDEEDATEILEWITMASNLSPRLQRGDGIDKYLSRYSVPQGNGEPQSDDSREVKTLTRLRWHGLLPNHFIHKVLVAVLKASKETWFSASATSFRGESYTILKTNEQTYIWEYHD
ncbi:hypothetical protein KC343_g12414 [Hortaea werneckii]|uniref:Uncharacterized protein n=1 Tax=Hortaea werneckii TaxID=91943 RepID=A0A3M7GNB3_HORWE|nr:hypothetical protein KC323_g5295 [Hortaea werneckii]KAI6865771.1 hypothetical protein KC338_g4940 [Hortaea werneckii]KAI7158326.1 hypothetical protein KC352_g27277 [Hortaea werneckii]KAI7343773.1 hypothetical protein KC320_g9137 [Hortaea werneckii]KAI7556106.1 hypothetical protein KC317_g12481 [Hortaea werneckii]